jgi:hypothetical protein
VDAGGACAGACPAEVAVVDLATMAEYDRPAGIGALVTVDTTRPVDA